MWDVCNLVESTIFATETELQKLTKNEKIQSEKLEKQKHHQKKIGGNESNNGKESETAKKKKLSEIETEKKWMVNGNNIRGKMKRLRLK